MSKSQPAKMYLRAPNVPDRQATAEETNGLPQDRLGVPIFWYWRPMISTTPYAHPKRGRVQFSQSELNDADRYTNEMIADGSKPYLPIGHGGKDNNQGFIWRTKNDDSHLWGLHGFVGESARENAARYETSVCLERNWRGGNGKTYPLVVTHNALVPDPVAMGLPDYMALSRDASGLPGEAVPIYSPAAEKEPDMTPEQFAMARDVLGQPELPEDQAVAMLIEAASTASRYAGEVEETKTELSRSADEVTDLRAMLDDAKGQVTTLSRSSPQMVDPEALADRADAYMSRVELGVANGDIPPFIATGLKGVVQPKGKPSAYMLSRSEDFDGRPMDIVLDLFKGSGLGKKLAATGEVTGAQFIEFARTEPGTGNPPAQTRSNPFKAEIEAIQAKAAAKAS